MEEKEYVDIVSRLPMPSKEQTGRFAEYVSEAHSWYKHLPLYPYSRFLFFLDPNAGRQRIETKSGRIEFADVKEARGHFHYSTRATKEYRENFGYWNYYAPYGSSFLVGTEEGMLDTRSSPGPHVLNSAGSLVPIPIRWQNAGGAYVTSLVHPHRNLGAYWAISPGRPGERIRYPEILQYQFETFPDLVRRALLAEPEMKRWEVLSQTKVEEILDDARRGLLCNMEQAMEEFLREVFGTGVSGGK